MAAFDDGIYPSIQKLEISSGEGFVSLKTTYTTPDGQNHVTVWHGTRAGEQLRNVNLDSDEYLISLSGYFHTTEESIPVVHSLTFQSNREIYGPFGMEEGTQFSISTTGKIVGFFGASGEYLNSIGAHFGPLP